MKLDYSISSQQRRVEYVNNLLEEYIPTTKELTLLSDYILFTYDKNQTKKEKEKDYPITTSNREVTIDKRQLSYEGLVEKLENGEDGLFSLITDNKEQKLDNKDPITQNDIDTIPGIKESLEVIEKLQEQYEKASGQKRKALKTSIIET